MLLGFGQNGWMENHNNTSKAGTEGAYKPKQKKPENDKKEKLAAALRDNLRRRKAAFAPESVTNASNDDEGK